MGCVVVKVARDGKISDRYLLNKWISFVNIMGEAYYEMSVLTSILVSN